MDFDPVLLARLQFAFTIIFHIIFPSFTIGLSAYIATLGAIWLRTGEARYQRLMVERLGSEHREITVTRADIARGQCINRPLQSEHIARMALFLAADDSAMCTAQNFVVDGGWV